MCRNHTVGLPFWNSVLRTSFRILRVAAIVLLGSVVPAAAEVVVYQFTGTLLATGETIGGTFFFDTDRVQTIAPVLFGYEYTFAAGGVGADIGGSIGRNTPSGGVIELAGLVSCWQGNGRDAFSIQVRSGSTGDTLFSFGISSLNGSFISLCDELPTQLSFPGSIDPSNSLSYVMSGSAQIFFLSTSLVRIGQTQDQPILPIRINPAEPLDRCVPVVPVCANLTVPCFCFPDVPTGQWLDPPSAFGFEYTVTSEGLFTEILEFPTGFAAPFSVSVGGISVGQFGPGHRVDFRGYPGGGVSSFRITGISPLVDGENAAAFPVKLAFSSQTASLTMTPLVTPFGDLNGDLIVGCADLSIVRASIGRRTGQPGFDPRADLNRDGIVNVLDLSLVSRQLPAGTACG